MSVDGNRRLLLPGHTVARIRVFSISSGAAQTKGGSGCYVDYDLFTGALQLDDESRFRRTKRIIHATWTASPAPAFLALTPSKESELEDWAALSRLRSTRVCR